MTSDSPASPEVAHDAAVLVRYSPDADERPSEALLAALSAAQLDGFDADTVVHDWVDADAVDQLFGGAGSTHRLSTVVWDHPVVVSPGEIVVYAT